MRVTTSSASQYTSYGRLGRTGGSLDSTSHCEIGAVDVSYDYLGQWGMQLHGEHHWDILHSMDRWETVIRLMISHDTCVAVALADEPHIN